MNDAVWDEALGTAGGEVFGRALKALAAERQVADDELARTAGLSDEALAGIYEGRIRIGLPAMARLTAALRSRPIEFMQKTGFLSLEVYAAGLDPLYFLPEGPVRYEARIYMREINPRHPVPEADMTRRNPAVKAIAEDQMLDSTGKIELELAYLLRLAAQGTPAKG
ncbi:MAG TPA: hypothetical protein VFL13_03750 [Candidatus Baltobacteraceae bacterium]|nr:hypothetical protein [Candidatus Baltobacteraceae bacterium]